MRSMKDHQRLTNVFFYRIGIGGKTEINSNSWQLFTLSALKRKFNETNVIINYLKLDVEGAEWSSLPHMLATGVLRQVRQLGIEIHVWKNSKQLYENWQILDQLEQQGFRRWYWALNFRKKNVYMTPTGVRSCCYEMVYINTNFLRNSTQNTSA